MKNFQPQKKGWRRIFESWIALILLFVLMIFLSFSVVELFGKMLDTRENRKVAEDKVEELRDKKDKLNSSITHLGTEKGIEENIREKFGFVKEGEEVIVIIEDENIEESILEEDSLGFWNYIKNWFRQ